MRLARFIIFCLFLTSTVGLYARQQAMLPVTIQAPSNVTTEIIVQNQRDLAVMNQKINDLVLRVDAQGDEIRKLMEQMAESQSRTERLYGVGIGIGAVLTAMEGIMIILTYKGKRNGNRT